MRTFVLLCIVALAGVQGARLRASGKSHGGTVAAGGSKEAAAEATAERVAASLADVIEVLATMMKEFQDQEVEDKSNWEQYSKWSDDAEVEKNNFIMEQKALVMSTQAKQAAHEQEVQKLTEDLATLASDIAETVQSINELVKMRQEEKAQFEATLADLVKTIAAVTKATEILEGHYASAGAELVEIRERVQMALTMYGVHSEDATQQNVKALSAFLQTGQAAPDYLSVEGSKYDNYEKQGGAKGVIGMMTDLRSQLESQKQDAIAKENESVRQYEETKAAKEADLQHMRTVQAEKTARKQECEAIIEQCIAIIDQANKEIKDSQEYLVLLLADRKKFAAAFKQRVAMRKKEMAATQAALDALQAVSAGAKSNVEGGAASFLQIGSSSTSKSKMATKIMATINAKLAKLYPKLVKIGEEMKSPSLIQMTSVLKAFTADVNDYQTTEQATFFDQGKFGPVLKLLNDLITRLEEEQAAETSQHEWCETEKETSVASKTEREKSIHELKGTIESLTTQIEQLKTEILFLESEIARVKEETRIAKEIRKSEHEVYVQAKKDHEEVIGAIQKALEALSGQYALLQVGVRHKTKQPSMAVGSTPFAEYSSGSSGAGSAMEMLQDLETRYTEALETIIREEQEAQKAHEELLKRNALFIQETTAAKNEKIKERRGLIGNLASDKDEMKINLIELHEVSKYLMDLRPSCDDIRSTYEERKKRREAEIAALKEALEVISDPTMMAE